MKKVFAVLICICLSLCGCEIKEEEKISTGYDSTYWGMSKEEVEETLSYVNYLQSTEDKISFSDSRVMMMRGFDIFTVASYNVWKGGYQFPNVTYEFKDDALCKIELEYEYTSEQDYEWYDKMVELLGGVYSKRRTDPIKTDDNISSGYTDFVTQDNGSDVTVMTIQVEPILKDYGSLYVSYQPNV